jgi:glycosyltransferase involved in cell wall biosynthesis
MSGDMPVYSICVTNFNSIHSVKQSLESLLSQVDSRFEIIVVDNESYDGSLDILRYYEKIGKIKLIIRSCSIGLGRQIGIQESRGKYIITQADMDDVFEPCLNDLLKVYHQRFEGFLLLVQGAPGMIIAPKKLIAQIGGYQDLNALEDKDVYSKTAEIGRFRYLKSYRIISSTIVQPNRKRRLLARIQKRYFNFREAFRLGDLDSLNLLETIKIVREKNKSYVFAMAFPLLLFLFLVAFANHWFYRGCRNKVIGSFQGKYYIVKVDTVL